MTVEQKDALVVCLLSWLVGVFGIHRFYQGKILTGVLWLLTGGLCGIGAFVDAIINTVNCAEAFTTKD